MSPDEYAFNLIPLDIMRTFGVGVDRLMEAYSWEDYIERSDQIVVNLGAGKKTIRGTHPLDLPDWKVGRDEMPFHTGTVNMILAFHFFEHLTKDEILWTLRECERVLRPGGLLNMVTPHWSSEAAHQDLDHKSFWSESTWKNLFKNPYYDGTMPREWKLEEVQTTLMGINQRNLCIVSQLRRSYR